MVLTKVNIKVLVDTLIWSHYSQRPILSKLPLDISVIYSSQEVAVNARHVRW